MSHCRPFICHAIGHSPPPARPHPGLDNHFAWIELLNTPFSAPVLLVHWNTSQAENMHGKMGYIPQKRMHCCKSSNRTFGGLLYTDNTNCISIAKQKSKANYQLFSSLHKTPRLHWRTGGWRRPQIKTQLQRSVSL